jgi:hypothetical protein
MVASFNVAAGIGMMPAFMSDGRMHRFRYDYFVVRVAAVVFLDKGAAGK